MDCPGASKTAWDTLRSPSHGCCSAASPHDTFSSGPFGHRNSRHPSYSTLSEHIQDRERATPGHAFCDVAGSRKSNSEQSAACSDRISKLTKLHRGRRHRWRCRCQYPQGRTPGSAGSRPGNVRIAPATLNLCEDTGPTPLGSKPCSSATQTHAKSAALDTSTLSHADRVAWISRAWLELWREANEAHMPNLALTRAPRRVGASKERLGKGPTRKVRSSCQSNPSRETYSRGSWPSTSSRAGERHRRKPASARQ